MKLRALLLTACLLALPGWAAGSLDALRAGSRGAREQVAALRAQQLRQRGELSALSGRIETLKASAKDKLLPGGELDAALKRSQELSGVLAGLAQQLSGREAELEAANLALLEGLSAELTRLRSDFDRQADRAVRRGLIDQLRRLRAEREALRQSMPATKLPALDAVRPSDDPEELLEQADLLRDNEEKLQRELKAVEARLAERREEAELDRRVQRFMGEESMFDDSDRRLRVQRTLTTPATAPTANAVGAPPPASAQGDTTAGGQGAFGTGAPAPSGAPGAESMSRDGTQPTFNTGLDSSNVRVTTASDARVQVGGQRPGASGDDDLDELEVERLRLQGLAGQLKKKAEELEKKAAALR
jgi:hypothetical protein